MADGPTDLLGIQGISDSVKIATQGFIDGAAAFLSRVCLPAAEEFGLALRDHVSSWRARNAAQIFDRANILHESNGSPEGRVAPRLVHLAMDAGSWTDDETLQEMWSGLLASAVSEDGSDDNLIFVNLLNQLSALQARVVNYGVENATKYCTATGLPIAKDLVVPLSVIESLCPSADIQRFDRELDHLRELGLIGQVFSGGLRPDDAEADITPTALALHMYVRSQGSRLSPGDYRGLPNEAKKPSSA